MKPTLRYVIYLRKLFFLLVLYGSITTPAKSQIIDLGKSYINVTKGTNGGTVETGDTLEIRASLVVRSGTYDSCGYFDVIPTGTAYIPNTIRVLTNEGKIYKQFTDGMNDDEGWRNGANIRINLGYRQTDEPARWFRRGRVRNNNGHEPSFYGSACIQVASFRVRVTAAIGTIINIGGGQMTYRNGSSALVTHTFPNNRVAIYTNYGICSNSIGVNALGTEFNGTFGSGSRRNRTTTSANVPVGYTFAPVTTGGPNDYYYGLANNTSTRENYTTSNSWAKPDNSSPTHRVFRLWDIIGDHTGAANPLVGNPATDTVTNNNGGYMLIVNAAYRIDSAFQHTISNLCPNTYYEISCWMRNLCSKCGCDSNGVGSGSGGYIPTAPGDSAGVYPNITFEVNGVDYYTTGNIRYTGQWVKKGFTFLTGPNQTSFTLKFFNNAPGGGGNDWALDDITVATCTPNLTLNPSSDPIICSNNVIAMSSTVTSFFNNYTYFKWERSTDNGSSWASTGITGGPVVPTWNGSAYQYTANYPAFMGTMADSGVKYRIVVATTDSNLNRVGCAFTETSHITVHVMDCGLPFDTELLSFTGKMENGKAILNWSTSAEEEPVQFSVERSNDGRNFSSIGNVHGNNNPGLDLNTYIFNDPVLINGTVYYRIRMSSNQKFKYSRIITLSNNKTSLSFGTVINPFDHALRYEVITPDHTNAEVELIDVMGKMIIRTKVHLEPGINSLSLDETGRLPTGVYTLRVVTGSATIQRRVVRK